MKIYFFSIILLFNCSDPSKELSDDIVLKVGQTFTRQFYSNEIDSLHKSIIDITFTKKKLSEFKNEVKQEHSHRMQACSGFYIAKDSIIYA